MWRAVALLAMAGCAAALAEQPAVVLRNGAASVEGRLRGGQRRSYSVELAARAVAIEMAVQPIRSAVVVLYDPDGARVLLVKEGAGRWTADLPKAGRYVVVVARAVHSARTSVYRVRMETR